MLLPIWTVYVASFLNLVCGLDYLMAVVRGKAQPNRVTLLLWTLAPFITVAVGLSEGVGLPMLFVFVSGLFSLLSLLASFMNPRAYWKLVRFDFLCGALSLVGLALWGITKNPVLALAFTIAAEILAAAPMIRKSYLAPESEHGRPFIFIGLGALMTVLATPDPSFLSVGFQVWMMILCFTLVVLIYQNVWRPWLGLARV